MKDINDILPRPKNMAWGALTNFRPTDTQIKQMNQLFPHNNRWHTVFDGPNETIIDGKTIKRRSADSMT